MDITRIAMMVGMGAVVMTIFVLEPVSKSVDAPVQKAAVEPEPAPKSIAPEQRFLATCDWVRFPRSFGDAAQASAACSCYAQSAPKAIGSKNTDYVIALLDARHESGAMDLIRGDKKEKKKLQRAAKVSSSADKRILSRLSKVAKTCDRKHGKGSTKKKLRSASAPKLEFVPRKRDGNGSYQGAKDEPLVR